jgi:hypothetical protein
MPLLGSVFVNRAQRSSFQCLSILSIFSTQALFTNGILRIFDQVGRCSAGAICIKLLRFQCRYYSIRPKGTSQYQSRREVDNLPEIGLFLEETDSPDAYLYASPSMHSFETPDFDTTYLLLTPLLNADSARPSSFGDGLTERLSNTLTLMPSLSSADPICLLNYFPRMGASLKTWTQEKPVRVHASLGIKIGIEEVGLPQDIQDVRQKI